MATLSNKDVDPRARGQTEVKEGANCSIGTVKRLNDAIENEKKSNRMDRIVLMI